MAINKVVSGADEAVKDIPDNAVLMFGGFGLLVFPKTVLQH